jgi:hypothetical protein
MTTTIQRNTGRLKFDSVSDMQSFSGGLGLRDTDIVYLSDESLNGWFKWDASSTETADGVDTIKITTITTGRFIRQKPVVPAANVIYNQGSTGAIDKTAEEKFKETVSVKDFGADPTGAVDSTAGILAADTYAASIGATLFFPAGTYDCTNSGSNNYVLFAADWRGDGYGSLVNIKNIQWNQGNPRIKDVRIVSTGTNSGTISGYTYSDKITINGNVDFSGCDSVGLRDNWFENSNGTNAVVNCSACQKVTAYGNEFLGAGFYHYGNIAHLSDPSFGISRANTDANSVYLNFSNNKIDGQDISAFDLLNIWGGVEGTIHGNEIMRTPFDGMDLYTAGKNLSVSGNFVHNVGNIGIQLKFDSATDYSGSHDGANNASSLTDSSKSLIVDVLVGETIFNTTDGSSGVVTANTATTITATLSGGTDNDWDPGDAYTVNNPRGSAGAAINTEVSIVGNIITDLRPTQSGSQKDISGIQVLWGDDGQDVESITANLMERHVVISNNVIKNIDDPDGYLASDSRTSGIEITGYGCVVSDNVITGIYRSVSTTNENSGVGISVNPIGGVAAQQNIIHHNSISAERVGIYISGTLNQWAASTAHALGVWRVPTSINRNGLTFSVTTAGTTGASEPTWPTSAGGTVVDGTVTWTAVQALDHTGDIIVDHNLIYKDWSLVVPTDNAYAGIFFSPSVDGADVDSNRITSPGPAIILRRGHRKTSITNNKLYAGTYGLSLEGYGEDFTFCDNKQFTGTYLAFASTVATDFNVASTDWKISGNTAKLPIELAISTSSTGGISGLSICDNHLSGSSSGITVSGFDGVTTAGKISSVSIQGNTFRGWNTGGAINIRRTRHGLISGNFVDSVSTGYVVDMDSSSVDQYQVNGNTVVGSASVAVLSTAATNSLFNNNTVL